MTFLLALLIGGPAIAAAVALVRALLAFFRDTEQVRLNGQAATGPFGVK